MVVRQGRAARASGFAAPTHYAVYLLIVQEILSGRILRLGSIWLRHLGEKTSDECLAAKRSFEPLGNNRFQFW